ncbi:hypothetical protein CKM354_000088600 [Cercospora kikuchii]|uniref:Uncharacterized protein n=1 Tax=Cercospora kikuchii TaxID=84275 RepID=A0A9P3FCD3_9PEZI|nr:uncharacterized protein CKM354_000088600 [Cercospora kikuchii]GIZ37440.1 hypothetical protein CKM354_000088600 [Cercospora kikuchii]
MRSILCASFIAVAVATGSGNNNNNNNAALCSTINKVVTSYSQQAAATKFCSSYLSLPPRSTITSTVTNPDSPPVTATETSYLTCASPVPGQGVRRNKDKRTNKKPEPKPDCYSKFTKNAQISTACSCLSIPTTPATTTTTVSSTTTTTVTDVATPTAFGVMAANLLRMHCLKIGDNAPYGSFSADGNPIIPSTFHLDASGRLYTNDTVDKSTVYAVQGPGPAVLFVNQPSATQQKVTCDVVYMDVDGTCELACVNARGEDVESICNNDGTDTPENIKDPFCLSDQIEREYVMVRVNPR